MGFFFVGEGRNPFVKVFRTVLENVLKKMTELNKTRKGLHSNHYFVVEDWHTSRPLSVRAGTAMKGTADT
jgi:hypothetical protein